MLFLGSEWGEPRNLGSLKWLGSRSWECETDSFLFTNNNYVELPDFQTVNESMMSHVFVQHRLCG